MIDPYAIATARCWIEVDLDALRGNICAARDLLISDGRDVALIPVLKGNAYGLGAVPIARHLFALGLRLFAVATVPEGLELKHALPDADVLVMGLAPGAHCDAALHAGLILTLIGPEQARQLSAQAQRLNRKARVHLKLNTGLNRLGFDGPFEELLDCAQLPGLHAEGIYTHLALHGEASDRAQLDMLKAAHAYLAAHGFESSMPHALDSIGMVRYPDALLSAVRLGAWLYGVCPKGYARPETCRPIARFAARVAQIRDLGQGAYIGYDDEHPLPRPARIATLTVGYADGYPRLNNAGWVEIHGRRAPVVGLTCMDQLMVDVSGVSAREGDEVTLLGGSISIDEYASWQGLNRNEALSRLSRRVPRVYISGGCPVSIADYFTPCNEVNL